MKAKSKDYSEITGSGPLWNGVYGSFLCISCLMWWVPTSMEAEKWVDS